MPSSIVKIRVQCPGCGEYRFLKIGKAHVKYYRSRDFMANCQACSLIGLREINEADVPGTACRIHNAKGRCDGYLKLTCADFEKCIDIAAKYNWRGWQILNLKE